MPTAYERLFPRHKETPRKESSRSKSKVKAKKGKGIFGNKPGKKLWRKLI